MFAFCCSPRFANEEPGKEAKEVQHSGERRQMGGRMPSSPSLRSVAPVSAVSWSGPGRRESSLALFLVLPLQLHNTLARGGGWDDLPKDPVNQDENLLPFFLSWFPHGNAFHLQQAPGLGDSASPVLGGGTLSVLHKRNVRLKKLNRCSRVLRLFSVRAGIPA